jgi:hypothetical protein
MKAILIARVSTEKQKEAATSGYAAKKNSAYKIVICCEKKAVKQKSEQLFKTTLFTKIFFWRMRGLIGILNISQTAWRNQYFQMLKHTTNFHGRSFLV